MASLVYDLEITGFSGSDRTARYARNEPDVALWAQLTEDELLGEFGDVPQKIRVAIRVEDHTPATAWLDAPPRPASAPPPNPDAGDIEILRQALRVLQARDWPGRAMLDSLIRELAYPRAHDVAASDSTGTGD